MFANQKLKNNMFSCRETKKEMFYLMAHNTFYLQLDGGKHMVMDHSDRKKVNLLPSLLGLFFSVSSKGSFICTIPQTGKHISRPLLHLCGGSGFPLSVSGPLPYV